jgi:tripeptide aminopeptidase
MINRERIAEEFEKLTGIDSVSFCERNMADALLVRMKELGFQNIREDHAGAGFGGNAGNLYGYLEGSLPGSPILLFAHMDTVEPGLGKKAVLSEDGIFRSQGDTVLGSDDVAGIVEILEGIRSLREEGFPHRDVEVVFSIAEEPYTKGVSQFDFDKIRAKEAYVLDLSGPVGSAACQAPSILSFTATVHGRASHAGFEPERGVNAIRIAAEALGQIPQGHLDAETTRNIGTIQGGTATNIVSDLCTVTGEVRSYDHPKALAAVEEVRSIFEKTAAGYGAQVTFEQEVHMKAYRIDETEAPVQRFLTACRNNGLDAQLTQTFGGSDNNQFAAHGIRGIVLSCGMSQVHSKEEFCSLRDLEEGAALVRELLTV